MNSATPGCKESKRTRNRQSLKHEHVCQSLMVEIPGSETHSIGFPEIVGFKGHIPSKKRATPQISKDKKLFRNLRDLGHHIG